MDNYEISKSVNIYTTISYSIHLIPASASKGPVFGRCLRRNFGEVSGFWVDPAITLSAKNTPAFCALGLLDCVRAILRVCFCFFAFLISLKFIINAYIASLNVPYILLTICLNCSRLISPSVPHSCSGRISVWSSRQTGQEDCCLSSNHHRNSSYIPVSTHNEAMLSGTRTSMAL